MQFVTQCFVIVYYGNILNSYNRISKLLYSPYCLIYRSLDDIKYSDKCLITTIFSVHYIQLTRKSVVLHSIVFENSKNNITFLFL